MTHPALLTLFPQIVLIVAGGLLLLTGAQRAWAPHWVGVTGLFTFILAGVGKALIPPTAGIAEIAADSHGDVLQWILLGTGGLFVALISQRPCSARTATQSAAMVMFGTSGAMLAVMADDLVLLSVALPLVYLPVGLILHINDRRQTVDEVTLKFAMASGVSLGLMLLGFVLLYASAGTTTLSTMNIGGDAEMFQKSLSSVAVVFMFAGLVVSLAAVPFHFAVVDVVDGVDAWTAGVMLLLPRLAAAGALLRICRLPMPVDTQVAVPILLVLAVTTILSGGLMALLQTRVQRLLAYLAIAQGGLWLLGLAVIVWWTGQGSAAGVRFAQAIWNGQLLSTTSGIAGLFAAAIHLSGRRDRFQFVDELTGLGHTQPFLAAAVAVLLLSLAGMPPLAGFWSLAATCWAAASAHEPSATSLIAFHRGFLAAAGAAVVGGLLTVAVAIRLCNLMFLQSPLSKAEPRRRTVAKAAALGITAAMIIGGFTVERLWNWLAGS